MRCQQSRDPDARQAGSSRALCWCSAKLLCFFAVLFALALGLLLGAVFFPIFLLGLPVLVALAVVFFVIAVGLLIAWHCLCCKKKSCG